jgi:hypothetical protein
LRVSPSASIPILPTTYKQPPRQHQVHCGLKMAHLRFPLASTCAVLAFVLFQQGRAQCYHPDGSAATSDYQPCHAGRQSMCCAINRSDGYVNRCRPDDLCLEINTGVIWRESCTDPTWQDPACLQLCTSGLCALTSCTVP